MSVGSSSEKKLLEYALAVGEEIGRDRAFKILEKLLTQKRIAWLKKNQEKLDLSGTEVEKALQLICQKFEINPRNLKIIEKTPAKIVYQSFNPCPILEACKVLSLDTREVCKKAYEKSVIDFLKVFNPRLTFKRNYAKIRPYAKYCEETIELDENEN